VGEAYVLRPKPSLPSPNFPPVMIGDFFPQSVAHDVLSFIFPPHPCPSPSGEGTLHCVSGPPPFSLWERVWVEGAMSLRPKPSIRPQKFAINSVCPVKLDDLFTPPETIAVWQFQLGPIRPNGMGSYHGLFPFVGLYSARSCVLVCPGQMR